MCYNIHKLKLKEKVKNLKKLKISNKILYFGFTATATLIMSIITFTPVQAMRVTECSEQNNTTSTYLFGSDDSENNYAHQEIPGNLVIEKGANVSERAFAHAIIKGNVIINNDVCLNR